MERDADGRDEKADWPELRLMTSTGVPASSAPGNEQAREPKGDEVSTYLASQQTDADFRSYSSSHPRLSSSGDLECSGWTV